jgi:hypothetical protein
MRIRHALFLVFLPLAVARAERAEDQAGDRPFEPGESLAYEIRLLGIETARAELEVFEDRDGGVRIRAKARTTGAADGVFRMKSQASCTLEPSLDPELCRGSFQSRRSIRRREIRFDKESGVIVERSDANGKREQKRIELEPGFERVQDTLSGLYLVRARLPDPGETLRFRAVVRSRPVDVEAETLRIETLRTDLGTFRTAVVEVRIFGDVDAETARQARLWITVDENRLPVKVTTKAPIGSMEAYLVAATGIRSGTTLAQK